MNISNKQEFQQIAFNHLSNICYEDFMNFYKKSTSKSYYCLVIDTTLASDLRLRLNYSTILTEKQQRYQH